MADIAQLGFNVDTSGLQEGKAALEAIVPAAARVQTATEKLEKQFGDTGNAADRAANGLRKGASAADQAAMGMKNNAGAVTAAAAANRNAGGAADVAASGIRNSGTAAVAASGQINTLSGSVVRVAEGYDILTGKMNSNFLAINNNIANMRRMSGDVDNVGKSLKFTAREGLGFTRQFADIGVTAAMGMSPFMIAIQQGPQLFDILQEKAISTGTTLGAVFRALGATIWGAIAPLLPLILGIAAVVGLVAAGFAIGARAINKGNDDIVKGLDLTDKQLKKVKKSGVETGVTIGDTFFGFFDVVGDRLTKAFDGPLKWLADAWNGTMDFITKYGAMAIKYIIGGFTGAVYAIKAVWGLLPEAIGDIAIQAANWVVKTLEGMINKSIDMINGLIGYLPDWLTGGDKSQIGHVSFGQFDNQFEGKAAAAGKVAGAAFDQGFKDGSGAVDNFFTDVGKAARKRATDRVRTAAGDRDKGPKGAKGPKTDAEKFADITGGAERDIAMLKAQIEGVNLTADAARRLANEQKLLNEASQKGIKLTPEMRTQLMALAGTITDLQTRLANLQGFKEIMETSDRQLDGLRQEHALIGLVGEELARARYEQEMLNQAKAKGIELDDKQRLAISKRASEMATQSTANDHDTFMVGVDRDAKERTIGLREELSYIGKSADEVARLRIENELLAQARQKNIDLTPADIAAIQGIAREQAELEKQIAKSREAMDFARGTIKGFFTDLTNGLRQGKSLWESFGDAVTNVLNKLIDRLLDKALEAGLDALFNAASGGQGGSGGSGGDSTTKLITAALQIGAKLFGSANGNVFDRGVIPYANGGTFTNGIVSSPTMFAFANGGALGVMGEAGPEAIMPLQRGSDGSLGVQMYGGTGASVAPVTNNIKIANTYTLTGAISSADILALTKKAAEDTKNDVKRSMMAWIDQYQRDGAFAS